MARGSLGPFPKTLRWHEIVLRAGGDAQLAESLLIALRDKCEQFAKDENACAVVRFLVALVVGSRSATPLRAIEAEFGIRMASADPCGLIKSVYELVPVDHPFRQAALMTMRSVEDAAEQGGALFAADSWQTWRAYDESAFCDLARLFFAHLNEVLFSAALADAGLRVDEEIVQRFAWEMSTIMRAFSARWFNACARYQTPEMGSIDWYLGHCLGKLDLELARETRDWVEPTGRPWSRTRKTAPQLAI